MIRINLFPWRAAYRKKMRRIVFFSLIFLGLLGAIFMVQMNAHLNQRIKKGKEELALLRDQVLRLQAYEKVERQITMLEDWKSGRQKTLQMFLKFVNDIPEDIGVERIERQEGKWTIEGEAPSRAPIVEWVRILTRQPIFQAVHLSSLDTKNAAVFHFRIQAKSFETLRGQI